ncbi:YqaJ-like viral recombinase domain containing protein [Leishmania donovani]|uniref:YqaJ-like_viral_recombinase_domain_containing_protein_-_putative n=3 Tax=Leishmania donovani species complex TaxID=38574 RepID=A0A6L0XNF5_LEIIN|nr:conserved hypothetical protein [Leishmania infantum JPCM5]TPP47164.1 YqaJ-like viral recombinase domain family protein [Leishmania donovani]CAC9524752.1 YqaJ-like_viral_recombinase_domain_containing_protein_-_putative [Leishmania infantum]CAJ1991692.1 YqaJ-like viral recombinase domain containing protein [Leishmania donovani]CAM70903.1 conserved hypothetical protein [Leishmania infantum JPCM5]SUZ44723.1 YqaJ-like_viral_recombinase_domain_containing_protein_-_putative [Leishmania infantum]|eukprot:XP_001467836.1 conserved hypothetical protein [Leishmania infantum JPCM5]
MAQHPDKLKWKDAHPHGLSASQFGMALGFCGRVSDYVRYLRDIVGTEHEFKGNAFTAHGTRTEPKARALYELLTGCRVYDGGFFVTSDHILGCSPDGRIYHHVGERPIEQQAGLSASALTRRFQSCSGGCGASNGVSMMERQRRGSRCSVHVPFKSKRRPRSPLSAVSSRRSNSSGALACDDDESTSCKSGSTRCSTDGRSAIALTQSHASIDGTLSTPLGSPSHHKVRLLEIKSPFRALYNSTKPGYQPFGIPMHYMCQIQGQLAIADCEECDFFVYLDHPMCQVEGWRVRRSRAFWAWAEPNLRRVSSWVKDGPPDWLNRSFAFTEFDFRTIEVVPLVFPFDITANAALTDPRSFAFFAQFANPFESLDRRREARGNDDAQAQAQDWCFAYAGLAWADITEYERIAVAAQTPAVRRLFAPAEADTDDTEALEAKIELWSHLSSWRRALEVEGVFEESATAVFWKEWTRTATAGRDPVVKVTLSVPCDWDTGRVETRCSLPSVPRTQGDALDSRYDTAFIHFHQRLFFASLLGDDVADPCERATSVTAPGAAKPPPHAALSNLVPFLSESVVSSSKREELERPASGPAATCVQAYSTASSFVGMAAPSRRGASSGGTPSSSVVCFSPRECSPSQQRVVSALSEHLCHCLSPLQCRLHKHAEERNPAELSALASDAVAATHHAAVLQRASVPLPELASPPAFLPSKRPCLVCEISVQELLDVIRFANDCEGVVLVSDSQAPLCYYEKLRDLRPPSMSGAADGTWSPPGSTLLVGETAVMQQLLHTSAKASFGRPSALSPLQLVWDQVSARTRPPASLVPCFVECTAGSSSHLRDTIEHLGGTPCFLVRAAADATSVLRQTKDLIREWGTGACRRRRVDDAKSRLV